MAPHLKSLSLISPNIELFKTVHFSKQISIIIIIHQQNLQSTKVSSQILYNCKWLTSENGRMSWKIKHRIIIRLWWLIICRRNLAQFPTCSGFLVCQKYDHFLAVSRVWACAPELTGWETVGYCAIHWQVAELNVAMEFPDGTGFWIRNL